MLDLVIRGGQVVTPAGTGLWDIGIIGEKIVAVASPDTLPETKKAIDATGKIVVPGGVEAHTHVGFPHLAPGWGNDTAGPEDLSLGRALGRHYDHDGLRQRYRCQARRHGESGQ